MARYLNVRNEKALSETLILGLLEESYNSVYGLVKNCDAVAFTRFGTDLPNADWSWRTFVVDFAKRIKRQAGEDGGIASAVLLDVTGITLTTFGTSIPSFSTTGRPIRRVVLLVGGPPGLGDELNVFDRVFSDHLDFALRVRLSGERAQHSGVAITAILLKHESDELLPALYDARFLGSERYVKWVELMSAYLFRFAKVSARGSYEDRIALLQLPVPGGDVGSQRPLIKRRRYGPDYSGPPPRAGGGSAASSGRW